MIEKISIENYRGIENLEVKNFKKYNLFVGDNSSCKTTLLEALFSAFLPNPSLDIVRLANHRGIIVKKENIHNFIYNADLKRNIKFILNDEIVTIIKVDENKKIESSNLKGDSHQNFSNKDFPLLLQDKYFLFNMTKKFEEKVLSDVDYYINNNNGISIQENNINVRIKSDVNLNKLNEFFKSEKSWISPYIKNETITANKIKSIIENKKKDKLLELINRFEPEIDDIFSDGEEILLSKKSISKMLPLSSFGNGLLSIVNIISNIVIDDIKFLFIDEIESGIHYLNYENFCSTLIEITALKNIQLFISTHSKEFLKTFYKEIEKVNEDISLYRFQKINNKIKEVYYSKEEAIISIENNWEVR